MTAAATFDRGGGGGAARHTLRRASLCSKHLLALGTVAGRGAAWAAEQRRSGAACPTARWGSRRSRGTIGNGGFA